MRYEPPQDPSPDRRARLTGWISFILAAFLVVLVVYFGYIAYEGSGQLTDSPTDSADCRTPATFGWSYEAINYDIGTDAALAEEADPEDCASQGAAAGDALTGPGEVRLAGWYIPAGNGAGPTGPTVVIAHGWSSNKSAMLDRAAVVHDAYNLVLVDFRNHGQSEASPTTQGIREAGDLRAIVDWLETNKAPGQIALLGVSMGGATALNEASRDERIDAVIAESTHATLANAVQARLDRGGYPLSMPGSWAALLGTLIRTGEDVSAADPVQAIARLEGRPVLLITGAQDDSIGPNDAASLVEAAEEAGSPVMLHTCEAAGHGEADDLCAEEYAGWVLGFLQRVLAPAG